MRSKEAPLKVLVAGLGNMGRSHALAYHRHPGFQIVGLVNRSPIALPDELSEYPVFTEYLKTLDATKPDLASINTYSETHAEYAIAAMNAGCHVFVEKPLATNLADAERVVAKAHETDRKLVVGYILRHHPSWVTLIKEARKLGGPYVFRLNLNQQSSGPTWETHKNLMRATSPIVDCGVHYVDVMCQISDSRPTRVNGMGLRLSKEIADDMYNYGHFQVQFEDGSVGWYEAGWGPMMSEQAFFVKDIISPNGSASIVVKDDTRSDDVDAHTRTSNIRIHGSSTDLNGQFTQDDINLSMEAEPDHQSLCEREQDFVLRAIQEDLDLERHMNDAVQSLKICLAADESIRSGQAITL